MAKTQDIQVLVDGGAASAGPPLGPALGPMGVPIGKVVADINKATEAFRGMKVPVVVKIDPATKTYEIEVGTPPASALIFKEVGAEKGSGTPRAAKVGDLSFDAAIRVAKAKERDLLGSTLKGRVKEVLGTANSCGVTCEGRDPRIVQREIDAGAWDHKFK